MNGEVKENRRQRPKHEGTMKVDIYQFNYRSQAASACQMLINSDVDINSLSM